jgi:hypothetical protein
MEPSENEPFILHDDSECSQLFRSVINTQKDLIVLMHDHTPILFNTAFQKFTGTSSAKQFLREFGALPNRFVPHDNYFHAGKLDDPDAWTEALMELPEEDRIVSMLSCQIDPYAFSVMVQTPLPRYSIVTFTDISQDLIKRIMIENDVSIDKESGAYDKDYFLHTAKSFQDAAVFNKKSIGITMIELVSAQNNGDETEARDFTFAIKSSIRQSDMLVRWEKKMFLLTYLIENPDHADKINAKVLGIIRNDPYDSLSDVKIRIGSAVQNEGEEITQIIKRAESTLHRSAEVQRSGL